ncbi:hypothetical protein TRVL_01017 [Trypanosoma vivax]|nr:hypothetical protein TRVL_01017 [Trypanosoma vivax]
MRMASHRHQMNTQPDIKVTTRGIYAKCTSPSSCVPELILIPPFYVLLVASISYTLLNAVFNYVAFGRSAIAVAAGRWRCAKRLIRHSLIVKDSDGGRQPAGVTYVYDETVHLLNSNNVASGHNDNAIFFQGISDPDSLGFMSPRVPASVANEALLSCLEAVRHVAQQIVFAYNAEYMTLTIAKSLLMLIVLQYHFDNDGGWDRFAVCSAANLMSGLLTPVLEYAAGLLLPLDQDREVKKTVMEHEDRKDSAVILGILVRVGRLQLENLQTVLVQGCTFIVFGSILLPAAVIFCVTGFCAFAWLFAIVWAFYAAMRYLYYKHNGVSPVSLVESSNGILLTPIGEFGRAVALKVLTLFLLQWSIQCSFLLGLSLLQGMGYYEALQLEIKYQLLGGYDPLKMTHFQWLCLISQSIL